MKPKILTVDDSKTIRLIVTKALKPFDVDVLEASNGVEGVAVAMREKPDLILLDLNLPDMSGMGGAPEGAPETKSQDKGKVVDADFEVVDKDK